VCPNDTLHQTAHRLLAGHDYVSGARLLAVALDNSLASGAGGRPTMPCSLPQSGHIGAALRWSEEIHACKFVAKGAAVEIPLEPLDDSDG